MYIPEVIKYPLNNNDLILEKECTILRIDSTNNLYIIYAYNNDITYKLLSKKEFEDKVCNNLIKLGREYNLRMRPILSNKIWNKYYIASDVSSILYENVLVSIERDSIFPDLFEVQNLKGLCVE